MANTPPTSKRLPKSRTTTVTSTLPPPPPSATAGHASYPYSDVNRKHTRPSRTNAQIVEDSKYGPKGIGLQLPSPLGSQSDRWVRPPTTPGGRYDGSLPTPTASADTSGGGGGYYGGGDPGDGGGGGGGGGPAAPSITWEEKYTTDAGNRPGWWKGLVPVGGMDPMSEYALLYNALIPFLSPEDQRQAASSLAALYPNEPLFQGYNLEQTPAPALGRFSQAPAPEYDYLTAQRAQNVLATLDRVREVMGKTNTDFGPGYMYLRNVTGVLRDYGSTGGDRQTRAQYLAQQGALDPLMAQAKTDALAAYGPAVQQLTNPFFSGGSLRDYSKDQTGRYIFGRDNAALF